MRACLWFCLAVGWLAGCSTQPGSDWIQGRWVFDEDYTRERMNAQIVQLRLAGKEELAALLSEAVAEGIPAATGSTLTFNGDLFSSADGQGHGDDGQKFEVTGSGADVITVRFDNGNQKSYALVDGRLAVTYQLPDGTKVRSYFQRTL